MGGGGIEEFDPVLARRSDGGNGFRLVGSTPHPAAYGPGAQGDTRHFERCAGKDCALHLDFARGGFSSHDITPSFDQAALRCRRTTARRSLQSHGSTGAARKRLRAARIALQIAARSATLVSNLMMAGCGACCTLR